MLLLVVSMMVPMFKLACWNIRGLNEAPKQKEVKNLIMESGCSICAIVETKVLTKNLDKMIWFSQNIPRHAFMLWVSVQGKLSTQDRMEKWELQHNQVCSFCKQVQDSHNHLFIDCFYAKDVWKRFKGRAKMDEVIDRINGGNITWPEVVGLLAAKPCNKSI